MRITHFINSLGTGGAESLVTVLAQEQTLRGHEVKIVTLSATQGAPQQFAQQIGLNVENVDFSFTSIPSWKALRKLFAQADVVHVHLFPCLLIASLLNTSTPRIFTEHSTTNRRRKLCYFRLIDAFSYKKMDAITAVSAGAQRALLTYFQAVRVNKQVRVIPNGISAQYFENQEAKTLNSFLKLVSIGTLDDRKNFRQAIQAMVHLEDVSLTIIGDGPNKQELQKQIDELALEDRVRLYGPSSDVRTLLKGYDALLISSTHEGFSLVALEAMASGLPVIAPDLEGLNEVVINNRTGLLSPFNDGERGLEKSIQTLQTAPELYSELSRNALEAAGKFSVHVTAEKYQEVYSTLLT